MLPNPPAALPEPVVKPPTPPKPSPTADDSGGIQAEALVPFGPEELPAPPEPATDAPGEV
jgi:hypothetical protein